MSVVMHSATPPALIFQATILHVDMDAFFTSVEQADHPELRGLPVIIGQSDRGVASAASYEARRYGVRSAMPIVQARALCPHGVFLPGRMSRYKEVSRQIMGIIRDVCPVVEQASVDEAFADISGMSRLYASPEHLARELKDAIAQATGLTCSVGVAPNKFLAKMCSDWEKPNGLTVLPLEGVHEFLDALPVSQIPGVGPRWLEELGSLGICAISDIRRFPREFWARRYGQRGIVLHERSLGIDERPVLAHEDRKSCSAEHTLDADTVDRDLLRHWLLLQAERVGRELRRMHKKGICITLKLKFNDFSQLCRNATLSVATDVTQDIYAATTRLLEKQDFPRPVRLIGTGVSQFRIGAALLPIGAKAHAPTHRAVDLAMDRIRDKFGAQSILRADAAILSGRTVSDLLSQKNRTRGNE